MPRPRERLYLETSLVANDAGNARNRARPREWRCVGRARWGHFVEVRTRRSLIKPLYFGDVRAFHYQDDMGHLVALYRPGNESTSVLVFYDAGMRFDPEPLHK